MGGEAYFIKGGFYMEEKYIKDLLITLISNNLLIVINELGQAITKLLIDNPNCLQLVVNAILIVLISYIINQRKK